MAQGTLTLFEEFSLTIANGTHDFDADTFKIALVSEPITGMEVTASPALGDFTEVVGTNYTAGGETLTTTWTEVTGVSSFKSTQGIVTWTTHASGPTDIKSGIVYNSSSVVTGAAVAFIDFTTDGGTTPISLVDGDITWTPDASTNIYTLS
jgi:hypothetical protein